jgi:hypothetical protein
MNDEQHKKIRFFSWIIAALIVAFIVTVIWTTDDKSDLNKQAPLQGVNEREDSGESLSEDVPMAVSPSSTSRNAALKVFKDFLTKAEAHDIEGVRALTYKQSEACADLERQEECFALMDNVVEFGKEVKEEEYVNLWEDKSQIILTTEARRDSFQQSEGYLRGYIYFVRDSFTGSIKVLAFEPNRGWFYKSKDTDTADFVEHKLQDEIKDSDRDGLTDFQESCLGSYFDSPDCTNTNPNERDTDGDGWWDGVEFYFNK